MNLFALTTRYIQENLAHLTDVAHAHVLQFAELLKSEFSVTEHAIEHLVGLGHTVITPAGETLKAEVAAAAQHAQAEVKTVVAEAAAGVAAVIPMDSFRAPSAAVADAHAAAVTETKLYTDGTTVTGPGPLPEMSPAQQDAQAGGQPAPTQGAAQPPADAGTPERAPEAPTVTVENPPSAG